MQAMLPISRELVKAVITRSFLGSSCRSRSHGWIPMVIDGKSTTGEEFSLAGFHPAAGSDWDSLRAPFSAKILCLWPGVPRGACPLARVSRALRLCFVVPAVTDIAIWRKPQNMLVQTNRAGGAAALPVSVVFRQHHCRLSSDVNWFRLGAFFLLARPTLTLLAGDFVPGFQDCPERAGP